MKTLALAVLLLVACARTGFAADAKKPADNYETLRTTDIFAFGGVGAAGTHVPAELAFNEVVKADNASAVFQRLLPVATPEGQLYALVGFHRVDHKAFAEAVPSYLRDSPQVNVARGCILSKEPAKGIIERIKAGDYK